MIGKIKKSKTIRTSYFFPEGRFYHIQVQEKEMVLKLEYNKVEQMLYHTIFVNQNRTYNTPIISAMDVRNLNTFNYTTLLNLIRKECQTKK